MSDCPTCVVCGFQRASVDKTGACGFCIDKEKAENVAFEKGRKQGAVDLADKIKRKLFEEENLYKNLYFKRKDICEIVNKELEGV